jgi:hypothetical protein
MDDRSPLLARVEEALGPVAATMFVERGRDRHFIPELTLAAVALYLLGKYLDGFIEGLGVNDLGKQHGRAVADAARYGFDALTGKQTPDPKELDRYADALSTTVAALGEHRSDARGLASGSARLRPILEEPGIPRAEAERLTEDIAGAIWRP